MTLPRKPGLARFQELILDRDSFRVRGRSGHALGCGGP